MTGIVLILALLLGLWGCGRGPREGSASSEPEPLTAEQMEEKVGVPVVRVLVDLPNEEAGVRSGQLMEALQSLSGVGSEFLVFMDAVPANEPERINYMTRVKTEIMAGKGPDLFLCHQNAYGISGISYGSGEDPFFTFPEKAMENRVFLPLDDYIEKAEYMEWDKFLPVIMEAGRNEEGQQIIPMAYFFPLTIAEKEKYGLKGMQYPKTRLEMAQSDNIILKLASQWRLPDYVGRVMEPGADEPMFTEEELLELVRADREMSMLLDSKEMEELSQDEAIWQGQFFRTKTAWADGPIPLGQEDVEYCMIPVRNRNDGVTANIAAFAAINRNARYPDLAFRMLDYIMRTGSQQRNTLFTERIAYGMPVHMELGSSNMPMENGWYMSDANFKEFEAARAEITEVRFLGPVDEAVWMIDSYDPKVMKKSVHEKYVLMEMLLGES